MPRLAALALVKMQSDSKISIPRKRRHNNSDVKALIQKPLIDESESEIDSTDEQEHKIDTRSNDVNPTKTRFITSGLSCHQCKLRRSPDFLLPCTGQCKRKNPDAGLRNCKKKYCLTCLKKHYNLIVNNIDTSFWKCPCCERRCICRACNRSKLIG